MSTNLTEDRRYRITFFSSQTSALIKSTIWDTQHPFSFGHPIRWIIEKNKNGIKVKYIQHSAINKVVKSQSDEFSFEEIQKNSFIQISNYKIAIHPVNRISDLTSQPLQWIPKPVYSQDPDQIFQELSENQHFKKLAWMSVCATLLFIFISHFIPQKQPTPDDVIPPQIAKILLSPAFKASENKNVNQTHPESQSSRRGSVVQAFQSEAVKKSAQKLVTGGALALLARSNLLSGTVLKNKVNQIFDSHSKYDQSAAPQSNESQLKKVDLNAIGTKSGDLAHDAVGYSTGKEAVVKGQGNTFVTLDIRNAQVDEGLTQDEVGTVIHAHLSEVRFCYESAILRDPSIAGKMIVDFKIDKTGMVSTASTKQPTLPDPALENCILSHLKTWKFPKPKGGIDVGVSYPFVFQILGQ